MTSIPLSISRLRFFSLPEVFVASLVRLFQKFIPRKISHQIFYVLVVMAIVPLVILGGLLMKTSHEAIDASVMEDHRKIAEHATGEVAVYLGGVQRTLLATASILGRLHTNSWQQETILVELSAQDPVFGKIISLDLDGYQLASSELGLPPRNYADHPAFLTAREGKPYHSQVLIASDHLPMMMMAEPVREFGRVVGVLMADVNLRSVWDIVDHIQLGKTGHAYLIDEQGRIIAHPDKKQVLANLDPLPENVVGRIKNGQSGNFIRTVPANGQWLNSYAPVENYHWGLIVAQARKEAFAFSGVMRSQSMLLIGLSILITILMTLFLSQYIGRSINALIEGTNRVAKGEFSQKFKIHRRDEMGQLLHSFNRMTQQLSKAQEVERLSVVGKAATAIAHELKNSLQLVKTFIHVLPERHRDKDFIHQFSEIIPKELDSWQISLQNMMDFSKKKDYLMSKVDLNIVMNDVIRLTQLRAMEDRIVFELDLQECLPPIMGNEDRIRQVFLNLLTNSLQAAPENLKVRIITRCEHHFSPEKPSHIVIKVINQGMISAEDLEKVFEPFYTTKANGLGLGLAISREIIEQHGGNIEVKLVDNQDICFEVRIPTMDNRMHVRRADYIETQNKGVL